VKELVESIVQALVDHPERVPVRQAEGAQAVLLELHVAPEDLGRVIGEPGRIADAIRVLLRAGAARRGKRVTPVIV
jgi:hypothetical protein